MSASATRTANRGCLGIQTTDWAIEGPFDIKYNARCGGLPYHGVGWYRKTFNLPQSDRGRRVSVEFDGAMYNAEVWLNGVKVGHRPFGYIGFACDLTRHLKYGQQDNVIAVRLSPEDLSSRWYPGAGIYRNVWLDVKSSLHVARWGTYITTPVMSEQSATAQIETTIQNDASTPVDAILTTTFYDADGSEVGHATSRLEVKGNSRTACAQSIDVVKARRWDVEDPYLYQAVTRITQAIILLRPSNWNSVTGLDCW